MTEEKVVVTPGLVVAETANALKVVLPTALPCPTEDIFSIPSVEDLLKPLLEIAQLPEKLDAKLALMKKEKEEEIVLLVKKLENPDLTAEEIAAILEEIRIKIYSSNNNFKYINDIAINYCLSDTLMPQLAPQ